MDFDRLLFWSSLVMLVLNIIFVGIFFATIFYVGFSISLLIRIVTHGFLAVAMYVIHKEYIKVGD